MVDDHQKSLLSLAFPHAPHVSRSPICPIVPSPPLQGRFIFVNKAMADLYGKKPADVVGTQPHAIVHDPQNLPRYEEMAAEERLVLEDGQEARCPERLFVDTKGVGRWFRAFKVPYRLIDGTQVWPPQLTVDRLEKVKPVSSGRYAGGGERYDRLGCLPQRFKSNLPCSILDENEIVWFSH
jgi:PAS domain-containing protein